MNLSTLNTSKATRSGGQWRSEKRGEGSDAGEGGPRKKWSAIATICAKSSYSLTSFDSCVRNFCVDCLPELQYIMLTAAKFLSKRSHFRVRVWSNPNNVSKLCRCSLYGRRAAILSSPRGNHRPPGLHGGRTNPCRQWTAPSRQRGRWGDGI